MRTLQSSRWAWGLLLILGLGHGGTAQAAGSLATPSNLALDLVSAPDLQVVRPTSPAAVTSELLAFFRDGAPFIGAAAFELTPWRLGAHRGVSLEEYASNPLLANMLHSSLSYASVPDADGIRAAVALRIRLRDDTDWRLNSGLIEEAQQILRPAAPADPRLVDEDADAEATGNTADEAEARGLQAAYDRHIRWNATQTAFGVGYSFIASGGDLSRSMPDSVALWYAHATGLGRRGQVIVSPRYSLYLDRDTVTPSRQVLGTGARYTYALEAFRLSVDTGLGAEFGASSRFRGLLGAAVQFPVDGTEERWVEAGLTASQEGDERRVLVRTGFAFGTPAQPFETP